ncbi:UNVERIFIED_CONTAM: Topoisomerase 1-associated factor 1, partial [Siphonaria sp. JEL0065]
MDAEIEERRLLRQDEDRNRVLNICSALGGFEEDAETGERIYKKGDECLDCLSDLKRILRADNETSERKVFGVLGEWNVLARDLLPLLQVTDVDSHYKMAMLIVELLVPLTWATSDEYKHSPNQIEVLLKYKEAFLNQNVVAKIMQVLLKSLAIPFRDRRDKDNAKIRLILTLFRNLLAIRDPEASTGASAEFHYRASLQEKLLECFYETNVLQLVLTFAASMEEKEFCGFNFLVLELVYLVFRDMTVDSILGDSGVLEQEALLKLVKQEHKAARPFKSSRHSRFGGTLSLNMGNGKMVNFFSPATALKSVETAMDVGKTKGRTVKKGQSETVTKKAIRNEKVKQALRETADSFLENSFNSLIASVKDDIDKERQHVVEGDYLRFLVVVKFFLEYQVQLLKITDEDGKEKYDFDCVTDFINSRSMMFVTKRMQIYLDEKKWPELQSSLECLKQMLVTLNAMAVCGNEEYQDASNNIQNNLYYEAYIVEAISHLCKSYKDQSFGYLKNLVETVHIFLKMLEKFSKSKDFMVVRRKKRQQAKKASSNKNGGLTVEETTAAIPADDDEAGFQDENYVKRQCVEHEFQFGKIEMDFAYENVVHTYMQLLQGYHELEPKYFHYATTLLHRVFIKAKMEPLLYKLSTLELFNRIILDERTLEPSKELKELKEFIRYVVKKFVAKAKEYPMLFVEVLFPKSRSDCRRIMHGADDDDGFKDVGRDVDDYGGGGTSATKRGDVASDVELEVQRDLTWSQKVGVVVSILAQEDKVSLLEWLETTLTSVATKRMFDEEQPDVEIENFDLTGAALPIQDVSIALKKDKKFHLLLELMKVTKFIEGDADIRWIIEKERSADDIISDVKFIRHFIEEPLDPQGKPLHKMIKKKPKKRAPKKKKEDEEDGDEEEPKERKKKAEKVQQAYLSKQFIEDSDDDDDAAFFEAERQRRLKAAELAGAVVTKEKKPKVAKQKKESAVMVTTLGSSSGSESGSEGDGEKVDDSGADSDATSD